MCAKQRQSSSDEHLIKFIKTTNKNKSTNFLKNKMQK